PFFPPSLELDYKPLFSLTYIFLSILEKTASTSFHYKIKAQNGFQKPIYLCIYTLIFPAY
ncbi:MAG: hypothetical protein QXJ94_05870, partial [Candidatus Bathyarchaeia archaeon]